MILYTILRIQRNKERVRAKTCEARDQEGFFYGLIIQENNEGPVDILCSAKRPCSKEQAQSWADTALKSALEYKAGDRLEGILLTL